MLLSFSLISSQLKAHAGNTAKLKTKTTSIFSGRINLRTFRFAFSRFYKIQHIQLSSIHHKLLNNQT